MGRAEALKLAFDAIKDYCGTEARLAAAMRIAPLLVVWAQPGLTQNRYDELIEKVAALEIEANG